jgi:hypothetical protein
VLSRCCCPFQHGLAFMHQGLEPISNTEPIRRTGEGWTRWDH